jgi:hypothetical protein
MTEASKKTKTEDEATEEAAANWLDAIKPPDPLPGTLGERKALVMGAIPTIPKLATAKVTTKKGANYSFKFVTHDQVARIARPLFAMFGIDYSATTFMKEFMDRSWIVLQATLRAAGDTSDKETSEWSLPLPDGVTPQEMGAILSYLTKHALQKTFLIDAGEEDIDSSAFAGSAGGGLPDRERGSTKPTTERTATTQPALQSKKIHPLAFGIPDGVWPKIAGLWHEHGTISEKQVRRLYGRAGSKGWTGDEVNAVLDHHLGVSATAIAFGEPYDAIVATFEKFEPSRTATEQLDGAVGEAEDSAGDEPPEDAGYPGPKDEEQDDIPF